MKLSKLIFSLGIPVLFIILGFYLIRKQDQLAVVVGYINIVFWSVLILFALYRAIKK